MQVDKSCDKTIYGDNVNHQEIRSGKVAVSVSPALKWHVLPVWLPVHHCSRFGRSSGVYYGR
jgi:hypothetical protein